ncbi:MAG TPA: 16S rRNA (uracil(1498)-N(3))-methyltransferase [Candidatus Faeciplasma gallinarum]|uniref:Ribosomal RNA small subunit methyltransferase E n=1 Tax=Candidatus Faeciplasma gallinarum TaxID=2840799 RepID=A0A9D1JH49_9FIRM|nr:16S rRNA (uracil(1498)-N(3))-methyltransferase [Candidatus Faeciplasma gallinarum]
MPRFFISEPPDGGYAQICGDDARHIGRSLRMRIGDEITVCCDKTDYSCKILSISDESVDLEVKSSKPSEEPSIFLTLFMAMPKLDKLELIAQKATELGACRIVSVLTSRCVSRPDRAQFAKKRERLAKIVLEAAKQSGRGIIPEVSDIISLKECTAEMKKLDLGLVCYEKGGLPLDRFSYPAGSHIGLLVGSEGGFEEDEIRLCRENGINAVWLGQRILRCETAPIAAISIIMHLSKNM